MNTKHSHHFNLSHQDNFERIDNSDDVLFYVEPRLVVHVDEHFITALGKFFGENLREGAIILDLLSSYKTHLPEDYKPGKVVGLGLNEAEMKANDQLNEYFVYDLNKNPRLPFPDQSFDAVFNTVSIQYLTNPVKTFQEVGRILKPGGIHIVSFSNRMFPTKAVRIWRDISEEERVQLVSQYFEESGCFEAVTVVKDIDKGHHSGGLLAALYNSKDPVYIVTGRRPQ